jgi:P pilus assembly chaperone PapD
MTNRSFASRGWLTLMLVFVSLAAWSQAGITASPTRLYFQPGKKAEQRVTVTNPNADKPLEVGISLNDWNYDSLGNNLSYDAGTIPSSCAKNVTVLPGSYFTLAPGESKEITVSVHDVPNDPANPVRTAMLYLTQLNPGDGFSEKGAAIKVTVRMGIKIYYTAQTKAKGDVEISNYLAQKKNGKMESLKLYLDNTGSLWVNGTIHYDLLNKETGRKFEIPAIEFYSLPGDKRVFSSNLPADLEKGSYTATAIVNIGDNEELKLAELDFTY